MRFIVTRTSTWSDNRPCDEAVPVTLEWWDCRTFKTEQEHDNRLALTDGPWRSKGSEHGAWEEGIRRRLDDRQAWAVDLPDLAALMAFAAKHGQLVIEGPRPHEHGDTALPSIEIYDGYRE